MNKKILLVEDEQSISYIYKLQLNHAGYDTETIYRGNDVLNILLAKQFDLVLLDIMLPEVNGIELLKAIKGNEKTKNIPVIMLTNLDQDEIMQQAFKYGAQGYWIKANYSPDQIVQEVNKFLDKITAQNKVS